MLKVHKKAVVPRYFTDCHVGEIFMHNDNVCMKVRLNNTDYVLNLESGKVLTGIHSAMLTVRPIDAELHVSG